MRIGLLLFLAGSVSSMVLKGQPADVAPQYRFGRERIPGATADEPFIARFSSEAARQYLEKGARLWAGQKQCVSCHTHGLFMAMRPAMTPWWGKPPQDLRSFFAEQAGEDAAADEYGGSAAVRMAYLARGLAAWDAAFSQTTSPETDRALREVFRFQAEDGSIRGRDRWPPLNSTTWHGSVMTALAIGDAPGWYESHDDGDLLPGIDRLKIFLSTKELKNDHERILRLWVSSRFPEWISPAEREELLAMVRRQQKKDGGWSVRTFATLETWGGGARARELAEEEDFADPPSDGYQTGLAVVVLRDVGIPASDPSLQRAVEWLRSNQRESGRWWTRSLNTRSRFHYSSYSGSAYAALALAKCDALDP